MRDWTGYNDYHSIQVAVNRRFSRGFAFGVAYTGMKRKALGTFDPFLSEADNKARNYTFNTSRPHSLVINYNYELPNASAKWDNLFSRHRARRLADLRHHHHPEPESRRLHLRVHRRADQRPVGQRLRTPRVAELRSQPAEQRADVRPPVPHRVRRARRRAERPVLHGYLDQRRVPSAGIRQPRHHVLQELLRSASGACSSAPSSTTRSTRRSTRTSTRAPCSTTTLASRRTRISAASPVSGRPPTASFSWGSGSASDRGCHRTRIAERSINGTRISRIRRQGGALRSALLLYRPVVSSSRQSVIKKCS